MIDDPDVRILLGDAVEQLATLPSESVQCIVTSPPFWGLRDYGTGRWDGGDAACDHVAGKARNDTERATPGGAGGSFRGGDVLFRDECGKCGARRVDQQIGSESTPDEWCESLVRVFREARRVLRSDGVLWLEVGDSYNNRSVARLSSHQGGLGFESDDLSTSWADLTKQGRTRLSISDGDLKEKDLVMAPAMLALALRADGWWLRSDVIWSRPNPMPESITDRPTKAHSYVFLLTKSARYYYDADAIREPVQAASLARYERGSRYDDPEIAASVPYATTRPRGTKQRTTSGNLERKHGSDVGAAAGREAMGRSVPWDWEGVGANARSVWSIATEPTAFAHFATMPTELARRCIAAGTSEHGCCPECGNPWKRITDRSREDIPGGSSEAGYSSPKGELIDVREQHSPPRYRTRVETTGWEPTGCTCEEVLDPVPCTVLDPFMGSGTTALVARRMGRRAVGVELNPAYLEIARERLSQQSLFA